MLRIRKPAIVPGVVSLVAGCAVWYFMPLRLASLVRPIEVRLERKDWFAPPPGRIDVYHSLAEAQAAFPREKFSLERPVDFSREKLVHISWRAVGCYTDEMKNSGRATPLFGHLAHRSRMGGKDVLFYIESPIEASILGTVVHEVFQQRTGEDWFAVPKNSHVDYFEFGTASGLDFLMVLLFLLTGGLTVAWCFQLSRRRRT